MSAVMKPPGGGTPSDPGFRDSQQPATDKQDKTFEALFVRQLKQVVLRIHETENVEQIMLEVSPEICKLFNADRLTLYAISDDETSVVSKIKTGLTSSRELKLPISPQSIAGYVAFSRKLLNLADVYDEEAL